MRPGEAQGGEGERGVAGEGDWEARGGDVWEDGGEEAEICHLWSVD